MENEKIISVQVIKDENNQNVFVVLTNKGHIYQRTGLYGSWFQMDLPYQLPN